jgi:hypothetical protein
MLSNTKRNKVLIVDILKQKEELGLEFFRSCIRKTNQFSTKYILQKVLDERQTHVKNLLDDIKANTTQNIDKEIISIVENENSLQDFCEEYDFSTLSFLEATQLAIRVTEKDIEFYKNISIRNLDETLRTVIEKILSKKSAFLKDLQNEYEKLKYKNMK